MNPKCLNGQQLITLSNEGYLVPCCWADSGPLNEEWNFLKQEHLNIKNVSSIEEILDSKEWKNFYEILTKHPEQCPSCCKLHCGENYKDSGRNYV